MNAILDLLPLPLAAECLALSDGHPPEELRLRLGQPLSVTVQGKTVVGKTRCDRAALESVVLSLCGGSYHTVESCLAEGFLPLPGGGRAGICGRLSDNGLSLTEPFSLVIRFPSFPRGIGKPVCDYVRSHDYHVSLLLVSPPGVGKTTALRDIAAALAKPPHLRRVAVIDTRSELWCGELFSGSIADRFDRYPRAKGIGIAIRTMSPEYIVCDEITPSESDALLLALNCGVPLIATAHALPGKPLRRDLAMLCEAGVFDTVIGLKRDGNMIDFEFTEMKNNE